MITSVAVT